MSKFSIRTRQAAFLGLVVLLLLLFLQSCSVLSGDIVDADNSTAVARNVEATVNAGKVATFQAQQTLDAAPPPSQPEQPGVAETLQAQQATLDAQSTALAGASQPSPEGGTTPLVEETADLTSPIQLFDWDTNTMKQAPGCGDDKDGPPCWYGKGLDLVMNLSKSIYIDPSWASPYLVFSHHYQFNGSATVSVNVDGRWDILWLFPPGRSVAWRDIELDLSKYKGQEIILQFSVSGKSGHPGGSKNLPNEWYILDPKIAPNFK